MKRFNPNTVGSVGQSTEMAEARWHTQARKGQYAIAGKDARHQSNPMAKSADQKQGLAQREKKGRVWIWIWILGLKEEATKESERTGLTLRRVLCAF